MSGYSYRTKIQMYEPKEFSEAFDVIQGNSLTPEDRESIRNGAYRLYEVDLRGTVYVVAKNPAEVESAVLATLPKHKDNNMAVGQEVKSVFEVTNLDRLLPEHYEVRVLCSDKEFHKGYMEPKLKAIVNARVSEKERKIAELKKAIAELEAQP
jgi:hypothetical protein